MHLHFGRFHYFGFLEFIFQHFCHNIMESSAEAKVNYSEMNEVYFIIDKIFNF